MPTLAGRRILVIGASAGIGRAFSIEAMALGARLVGVGRRAEKLQELPIDATGSAVLVGDVTDPGDCARIVDHAVAHLGALDLVVYAAGVTQLGAIADFDADAWRRDYDVNVIGANAVCASALAHVSPEGMVMLLSSEQATETRWGMSSYSACKAALDASIRFWQHEHPAARFQRVVVGATFPTDFGRDFGGETLTTALNKWAESGVPMGAMDVGDMGRQLAEMAAVTLAHPNIDTCDVRLRPLAAAPSIV